MDKKSITPNFPKGMPIRLIHFEQDSNHNYVCVEGSLSMVNESAEREPYLVVVSWPGTLRIQIDASIQRIRMTVNAKSAAEARMIASLALSFMGLCGGKVTYVRKLKGE